MNKQEILDEMNKTKEHLANMEKLLEEVERKRWKPEDNEKYWFITDYGTVNYTLFMPKIQNDNMRFKNYNCFPTREQAELETEKILVRRRLEDIARRLNKSRTIDWNNYEQAKHCIELYKNNIITNFYSCHKSQGTTYCLDGDFKDIAIQEIGEERLKKYLRGK
nr:MAG TPA: hypothetical protein [Caudoviricetes sp.]